MDQLNTQLDYEFAGFRLDTSLQVLVPPGGEPIRLNSKVFATLLHLVQHAGEPLDKRSLLAAVWPDVVVEENNLNQCIVAIRKALGESAGDRRFILTLPGRGFKFVAPVRTVPVDRVQLRMAAPQTSSESRRKDPRLLQLGLGAVLLAVGAVLSFRFSQSPVTRPAEYVQLTDEAESASAPALSPDGRMLAFIRGGSQFLSTGQICVKLLPGGEAVRLTSLKGWVYAPAFSPDSTRVSFTYVRQRDAPSDWDTWTVPVIGGEATHLLPNASGLSWIEPGKVMYSEVRSGAHMGIVTSTESRAEHRDIYFPAHERAMAHFSYPSPDSKSLLVVEMNPAGEFQKCRLVPFDGSSGGTLIGPAGSCISAAWSPDGEWMYFAAEVAGHSHLWRQRYPAGEAEQITFGPTDELAVVAAPDGKSLITSLGSDHSSIWIHDANGERRLTEENVASQPRLSSDGQRLYYLRAPSSRAPTELRRLHLSTNLQEALLPGFTVIDYNISPDEREVAFATERDGEKQIWIAAIDRHVPPRLIVRGADQPAFGGQGRIFYRQIGARANFLVRIDGGHSQQVLKAPILDLFSVSPDGQWVVVGMQVEHGAETRIISSSDETVRWARNGWWSSRWSPDGRMFYFEVATDSLNSSSNTSTLVIPVAGDGLPADLTTPFVAATQIPRSTEDIAPGPDPATYVFANLERRRNIFRIPLH